MTVVSSPQAIQLVSNSKNPKRDISQAIGSLDDINVMFNMVLVATYIRPEKTTGGIIRPGMNVAEDEWQGKVGLVLKLGPNAFVDDENDSFYGQKVEPGEWCVFKVGDAWSLKVNGYPCRLVRDSSIKLKVLDPNIVF